LSQQQRRLLLLLLLLLLRCWPVFNCSPEPTNGALDIFGLHTVRISRIRRKWRELACDIITCVISKLIRFVHSSVSFVTNT